jgi:hypothetical protein
LQSHTTTQQDSPQQLPESKREKKKLNSIFDKDGKYKQQFEAFEA